MAPTNNHVVVPVEHHPVLASALVYKSFDIGSCSLFCIAICHRLTVRFRCFGICMWVIPKWTSMSTRVHDYEMPAKIFTKELENLFHFLTACSGSGRPAKSIFHGHDFHAISWILLLELLLPESGICSRHIGHGFQLVKGDNSSIFIISEDLLRGFRRRT